MKFYIPPTIKSDFEDWLNTNVANVNYDFEIIRDWYDQAAVKRIRATYFPIAWKSKIGNSDANSNFKTGYGWEIRKGDIAVREDGTMHSRYRVVNRVDSEIEIEHRHGIINLMARRIAGEEQR